jgi:pyruvate,water dikinase
MQTNVFIKKLAEISINDLGIVGGKNASLGEMYNQLSGEGIKVPGGFATTAASFEFFLSQNDLRPKLQALLRQLDRENYSNLPEIGFKARQLILSAQLPGELCEQVLAAYAELSGEAYCEVAVRSSATAEDLPDASFAGQHESFLNVKGEEEILAALHNCFASLYTDRAIKYREDKGFAHEKVLLSVGIQRMVRSDKGSAGVAFTLEPESGFPGIIHISGVWGLGENIVQGTVTPDEFFVFKHTLRLGRQAILQKKLGDKLKTMVYAPANDKGSVTMNLDTSKDRQDQFVLNDADVLKLARWCLLIEDHYKKPMDIEWARDGITGEIFIVQARPETVHSQKNLYQAIEYRLLQRAEPIARGEAIGTKLATGVARLMQSPKDAGNLNKGEIVVTDITSPDWDPLLKKAGAIVTNKGGRTSHASIVAREMGVPAVVGTGNATGKINDGDMITVSCCEGKTGFIYKGELPYKKVELDFSDIKKPAHTEVMLITADPEKAFQLSFYPNDGVGLLRMEFIITHFIRAHPMALVKFNELKDAAARAEIEALARHYPDKEKYFIDKLAQGIATMAAAFYPKDVIVRMSDFKSNEYANLVGGKEFEPVEENPMLGFRGASRYYHPLYKPAFRLECEAIRQVREDMGLTNVKVMIPFCRTPEEGKKVVATMSEFGLDREKDPTLSIYVMAELPSNVIDAEEFAKIFDGFSIGSNDLTQLTLGIDRDSALVADLFDENNSAVKMLIAEMISKANSVGAKVGLCGQAPSDFPAFAGFLVEQGISSISFNPDALIKGIDNINRVSTPASKEKEMVH